jgi:hypothetical protein
MEANSQQPKVKVSPFHRCAATFTAPKELSPRFSAFTVPEALSPITFNHSTFNIHPSPFTVAQQLSPLPRSFHRHSVAFTVAQQLSP